MSVEVGAEVATGEAGSARGQWQVDALLRKLLTPAARARGFAEAGILDAWADIVGAQLAARCEPMAVRSAGRGRGGGIVVLQAGASAALELQHAAPQIVQRINRYFGFAAVRGIRLLPVARFTPRRAPPPAPGRTVPEAALLQRLESTVAPLAEPGLRDAVLQLGIAIATRRPAPGLVPTGVYPTSAL